MTSNWLHPLVIIFLFLGLSQVFSRGRRYLPILAPITNLWILLSSQAPQQEINLTWDWMKDITLTPYHVDSLNYPFLIIFHLAAAILLLYNTGTKQYATSLAGLFYYGSAVSLLASGDMFTFYCFWELLAITGTFVVFQGEKRHTFDAAMRYLLLHIAGGMVLLFGIIGYVNQYQTINFPELYQNFSVHNWWTWCLFLGIGINTGWPLVHTWITDAYPESSIAGTIFLSAFTTKTAVYALCRFFSGEELLIPIGCVMAIFPIFYAVIENNLRKVLAYSMINQIGFMVVSIGIGGALGINGAVAHACADIIFKGLLFMTVGAAILRTGTSLATNLGGLAEYMPWTAAFCLIGAASISAAPLFSGFASKSIIVSATAESGMVLVWFILIFASAGVFHHAGFKIPFFTFYGHKSRYQVSEAPWQMLVAMGISSIICIAIGLFPDTLLYNVLPHPMDYNPYTPDHILSQLEILLFSAFALCLTFFAGIDPPEKRAENLDVDVVPRTLIPMVLKPIDTFLSKLSKLFTYIFETLIPRKLYMMIKEGPSHFFYHVLAPFLEDEEQTRGEQFAQEQKFVRRYEWDLFPSAVIILATLSLVIILWLSQ